MMSKLPKLPSNSPLLVQGDLEAKIQAYQVLGERCSGTNFVSALIGQNLDLAVRNTLGWKHGFPSFVASPSDLVAVVVFRSPYKWLASMFGKPWHSTAEIRALEFPAFLRHPWESQIDKASNFHFRPDDTRVGTVLQLDRHPITGKAFENLCMLRNAKNRAFLGMANRGVHTVLCRHEDITADPEGFVTWLGKALNLKRKSEFILPEGHFGWKWASRPARKYGNVAWTDADLSFVNEQLNWSIENSLGYTKANLVNDLTPRPKEGHEADQPDRSE